MKVLISGGGIAGLTLAFWLRRHNHQVLIIEKSPRLRTEGYMIDFFGSGYDVAEKMGLIQDLSLLHYQIPRLTFVEPTGQEKFSLDYLQVRKLFDDRHFNFMRGDLERVLYSTIKANVEVRFDTTIDTLQQDNRKVRAKLSDGSIEDIDLLVGAEGLHSTTRRAFFGADERFERSMGYHTAAFIIEEPPKGINPNAFYTLTEPLRQVSVYPIRGGRLAAFFIHKASQKPGSLSGEGAKIELRDVYKGMGWIVPELLARLSAETDVYFDNVSQVELPSWSSGRVVLVGDACQCVSLISGQGASMAMAGAYILAEELGAGHDYSAALTRYERRVKPSIKKKQRAGRKMARWFVPEGRFRMAVRDAMLRLSSSGPLASWLLKRQLSAESIIDR
jgi:2-polyprenyl-6-methoxyphenol hydroxylase-like FAD-dependent oxidoreductase